MMASKLFLALIYFALLSISFSEKLEEGAVLCVRNPDWYLSIRPSPCSDKSLGSITGTTMVNFIPMGEGEEEEQCDYKWCKVSAKSLKVDVGYVACKFLRQCDWASSRDERIAALNELRLEISQAAVNNLKSNQQNRVVSAGEKKLRDIVDEVVSRDEILKKN